MPMDNGGSRREGVNISVPVERDDSSRRRRSLHDACLCAKAADDYRGQNTVVLDLTGVTPIFDYFVLTTGSSPRQMRAITDEVDRVLRQAGSERLGVEGYESSTWILQDYGDVVLHVFTPETRSIYDLERLWADAPHVDWRTLHGQAQPESNPRRAAL